MGNTFFFSERNLFHRVYLDENHVVLPIFGLFHLITYNLMFCIHNRAFAPAGRNYDVTTEFNELKLSSWKKFIYRRGIILRKKITRNVFFCFSKTMRLG